LHFNSHHALVQWTAGIRLAIYEHSTLQEAYTGALIAGKAKSVNNINVIMERSRVPIEHWVRVRFGAGVPWRRCWCVINPPDEKEYAKMQKELKKRSPYDRSPVPALKGDIRFYDNRIDRKKQKKAMPIASITDAYSAYAIYPQAKALVDASTLLKIEGNVTIHSEPPTSSEGFVFIMPEVPPAVNGFEMLLRFMFPTWDTFNLYGRPGRLIASVLDSRSLMFAMPKHKRYGYLDVLDVSGLIVQDGSSSWTEKDWRKQLKEITGKRMNATDEPSPTGHNRTGSRQSNGSGGSGNGSKPKVGFAEQPPSGRSSRSFSLSGPPRTDSAPPDTQRQQPMPAMAGVQSNHTRNSSDPNLTGFGGPGGPYQTSPQRKPAPPTNYQGQDNMGPSELPTSEFDNMRMMATPEPVSRPPAFNHGSQARPVSKVYHSPELRQANSRLSAGTLSQLATAGGMNMGGAYANRGREDGAMTGPSVLPHANSMGTSANDNRSREVLNSQNRPADEYPAPLNLPRERSRSPLPPQSGRPSTSDGRRPTYPPPGGPAGFPGQPNRQGPGAGPRGNGQPPTALMPGGSQPNAQQRSQNPPRPGPNGPPNGPHRQNPYNNQPPGGYRQNEPQDSRRNPAYERGGPGDKHISTITTNDIIDHYARDTVFFGTDEHPLPERPRAGVMKTVGGAEPPLPALPNEAEYDVPDVNFGPTYNYGAKSPPRNRGPPQGPPQGSPGRPNQGPRPNQQGQHPPGPRPGMGSRSHTGDIKRTQAWQPSGGAPGAGAPGVSPEQYVQQRAAAQPQYAHARTPSGNILPASSASPSPALRRRSSHDMLPKHQQGGAGDNFQSGNVPSHMNAREQEYMARSTGGPLVNMPGPARGQSPGPGLVNAIDARERERQQVRQGVNSHAAQFAMNQHAAPTYQQQWGRSMSPGPGYGGPRGAPSPSFSQPMRSATPPQRGDMHTPPPQGQYTYGSGSGRNHPQYQGQAF
jgi:CCR4-NOT transcriptional complex subunit CAF120